jgi:hypothetical protein
VQRRNEALTESDLGTAWSENLILEKYYAPVLDRGSRLPSDQRGDLARRALSVPTRDVVSTAPPYPIYIVPRGMFWTTTAITMAAAAWLCLGHRPAEAVSRVA